MIDGGLHGATIGSGSEELRDGREDADVRLVTNSCKRDLQIVKPLAVDDLTVLHHAAGGDVHGGHIPTDVGVTDDRVDVGDRHRDRGRRTKVTKTIK